jgi:hypothetical protein
MAGHSERPPRAHLRDVEPLLLPDVPHPDVAELRLVVARAILRTEGHQMFALRSGFASSLILLVVVACGSSDGGGTGSPGSGGSSGAIGTGGTLGTGGAIIVGSGGCSGPLGGPVPLDSNCPDLASTPTTGVLAGQTFTLPGCCELIGVCGVRYRPMANGCTYPAVCGVPSFVPGAGAGPHPACTFPADAGP